MRTRSRPRFPFLAYDFQGAGDFVTVESTQNTGFVIQANQCALAEGESAQIWVANADGSGPKRLTDTRFTSTRTGTPQLFVMTADSNNQVPLPAYPSGGRRAEGA